VFHSEPSRSSEVGRCRFIVSKPVLKAPTLSALETTIYHAPLSTFAFKFNLRRYIEAVVPRPAPTHAPPARVKRGVGRPRLVPAQQQARLTQNAAVAVSKHTDDLRRAVFLQKHLAALRPFISGAVLSGMTAAARSAAAGALPAVPPPVEAQPDGIGGVMREY